MAQIPVRMNTQGMTFPLLSKQSGRTVIDGSGDLTYVPGVSADGDSPEMRGIPDIMFCENVMPSTYGWQSIKYLQRRNPSILAGDYSAIHSFVVHGATVSEGVPTGTTQVARVLKRTDGGEGQAALYLYDTMEEDIWVRLVAIPLFPESATVSYATVNGYTIIYVAQVGAYVVNIENKEAIEITLNGLTPSAVEGIFSANGYLLVWTLTSVAWSAVNNPLDFVPSDVTGAGGGSIQEAKGIIKFCLGTSGGFFIFTDLNCVGGVYTANEDFPFEYREIQSVGGINDYLDVSTVPIASNYYAYTSKGIQRLSQSSTGRALLSNISDFINAREIEFYNYELRQIESQLLSSAMVRTVSCVGDRYLVISYGPGWQIAYSHAIVIDTLQNRMGKLVLDHVQIIEYQGIEGAVTYDRDIQLGLLLEDGSICTVEFNTSQEGLLETNSVLILGKLQYVRSRFIELQEVHLENVTSPVETTVVGTYATTDGKSFLPVADGFPDPDNLGRENKIYYFSHVGLNQSLLVTGDFNLSSIVIYLNVHGVR